MALTLKAPAQATPRLISFWALYFSETPTCTCSGCSEIAVEVDPYFPYLDDLNRCAQHRLDELEAASTGSVS